MQKTYIIAEAGVNHNGSIELARSLVDAAVDAGADAVKFQTFKAENLVSKKAPKATYQKQTTDNDESQFDMLKKLQLSEQDHFDLLEYCEQRSIDFISTPFDIESLHFLIHRLNVKSLKLSSGEITNGPLLLEAAKTGKPIFLSTGMSTLSEIEAALGVLAFGYMNSTEDPSKAGFQNAYISDEGQKLLKSNVTLLHCTTEYPAPLAEVNLKVLHTMKHAFSLEVGYSDHTKGIAIPVAAATLGASVIEKHFTLDRNLPGPDHQASLEPHELKEMVQSIRDVELAMGGALKAPVKSELNNITVVRKSIVALEGIKQGEVFSHSNLGVKRPGRGISPMLYWEYLGKEATKDYSQDDEIL
ncbi:N-acetylneuraminate synthase [Cohnella mopanensis]|uniref:N-acetylneuraminate synthase n=1 Tax=Cohnella mopanensis TaxID=2911966 RepID=UPI001EF7A42E